MAGTADESPKASSPGNQHATTCKNHEMPRAGYCSVITRAKRPCRRHAKLTRPGYMPECGIHHFYALRAGQCQAIEECGQPCNRLTPYNTPYHLCEAHVGTTTLPCYLMQLPTELRLMIIRHFFPKAIDLYGDKRINSAILKVNRQMYADASSVLYGELPFEALVTSTCIRIFGKRWVRHLSTIAKVLCPAGARRIRNLNIVITFQGSRMAFHGIGTCGISQEDQEMYALRDSVRKLVSLLKPSVSSSPDPPVLKRLQVRISPKNPYRWEFDEFAAAIFFVLEPLQDLGRIDASHLDIKDLFTSPPWDQEDEETISDLISSDTYCRLKKDWLKPLKRTSPSHHGVQINTAATQKALQKIEDFIILIHGPDSGREIWTHTVFGGFERPLHLARVAYENGDIEAIKNIQEAIKIRWVNAHRRQQKSLRVVANSIRSMFDDEDRTKDEYKQNDAKKWGNPSECYPDAFHFEDIEPVTHNTVPDGLWLELSTEDIAPKHDDPSVIIKEDRLRLYIRKDGKEWVRLKTPATVRVSLLFFHQI